MKWVPLWGMYYVTGDRRRMDHDHEGGGRHSWLPVRFLLSLSLALLCCTGWNLSRLGISRSSSISVWPKHYLAKTKILYIKMFLPKPNFGRKFTSKEAYSYNSFGWKILVLSELGWWCVVLDTFLYLFDFIHTNFTQKILFFCLRADDRLKLKFAPTLFSPPPNEQNGKWNGKMRRAPFGLPRDILDLILVRILSCLAVSRQRIKRILTAATVKTV